MLLAVHVSVTVCEVSTCSVQICYHDWIMHLSKFVFSSLFYRKDIKPDFNVTIKVFCMVSVGTLS